MPDDLPRLIPVEDRLPRRKALQPITPETNPLPEPHSCASAQPVLFPKKNLRLRFQNLSGSTKKETNPCLA